MNVGFVNRILIVMLALLGFAACKPEQEQPDMYGCPVTDYNEERSVTVESDGDTVATENPENSEKE